MAKTKQATTAAITETYTFNSEKGKSWRYDYKDSDVVSSVYLRKSKWPKQPGGKVKITFQVEGDAS